MKALLVDDSKVVRTISGNIMKDLKIDYEEAEDGKVALEQIKKHKFDFIMLDWNMPNMDGMEFLKQAKSEDLLNDAKVIFCTTESEIDKITSALTEGASEYIMKPYSKDIVLDKLKYLEIIKD